MPNPRTPGSFAIALAATAISLLVSACAPGTDHNALLSLEGSPPGAGIRPGSHVAGAAPEHRRESLSQTTPAVVPARPAAPALVAAPVPAVGIHKAALATGSGSAAAGTAAAEAEAAGIGSSAGARVRVAIVSDMNSSYGSTDYRDDVHDAVDDIIRRRPDLILSTGDMVAGQRRGLDYRAMWRAFDAAVVHPFALAGIPFAATPGNHDGSSHPYFSEERDHYRRFWERRKPSLAYVNDDRWPFNYSFTFGHAYIISLDSTQTGPLQPEVFDWLRRELQQARTWPVVIVYGHVPLYAFAQNRENEVIGDPRVERLFVENNVDIAISGHHHTWYPGRRGELRLAGAPCLGSGARRLIGDDEVSERGYIWMEFDRHGIQVLDSYPGEGGHPVDRSSLPVRTGTERFPIDRDDVHSTLGPAGAAR